MHRYTGGIMGMDMRMLVVIMLAGLTSAPAFAQLQLCGDHDGSGAINTTDALLVLRRAVGQQITLMCPASAGPGCGNGVIDAGEDCDFGDLGGQVCEDQGQFGIGLACGPACLFDTAACSIARLESTGRGTVIDHQTGLEWQKTDDLGGLTDKDTTFTWSAGGPVGSAADGTAFTVFVVGLNDPSTPGGCYAGRCDWRLPTSAGCCGSQSGEPAELESIVDLSRGACGGGVGPCIDPIFGPAINAAAYLSASTSASDASLAWSVFFANGGVGLVAKEAAVQARAVRGGP